MRSSERQLFWMACIAINKKQESPPAWMQEAYRPRRIKYSTQGGVMPPGRGTPLARSDGRDPRWGYPPTRGTPWTGPRGGGYQGGVLPQQGYPPARSNGRIPEVGYPPSRGTPLDLAWVPPPNLDLAGVPPLGVDRQMDGWTDMCQKHNLPSYYVRGRLKWPQEGKTE